jgi:hypothetical protein
MRDGHPRAIPLGCLRETGDYPETRREPGGVVTTPPYDREVPLPRPCGEADVAFGQRQERLPLLGCVLFFFICIDIIINSKRLYHLR